MRRTCANHVVQPGSLFRARGVAAVQRARLLLLRLRVRARPAAGACATGRRDAREPTASTPSSKSGGAPLREGARLRPLRRRGAAAGGAGRQDERVPRRRGVLLRRARARAPRGGTCCARRRGGRRRARCRCSAKAFLPRARSSHAQGAACGSALTRPRSRRRARGSRACSAARSRRCARLGGHELVVFARHPDELSGADRPRHAAADARVGAGRARRGSLARYRLDGVLTWTERLPVAGRGRYAVWLFEPPTHRIEHEPARSARARGSAASDARHARRSGGGACAGPRSSSPARRRPRTRFPCAAARSTRARARRSRPARAATAGTCFRDRVRPIRATIPATVLAAFARSRSAADVRLRRRGRLPRARAATASSTWAASPTTSSSRSTAARPRTSTRASTRASASRCSRRWPAGRRSSATGVTSIPEIVGGAALLGPAARPGRGSPSALVRVLADDAGTERLRAAGLARAAEFTWERTARELVDDARGGLRVIVLVHGLRAWGAVERYVAALVRAAPATRSCSSTPTTRLLAPFGDLGARTVPLPGRAARLGPALDAPPDGA